MENQNNSIKAPQPTNLEKTPFAGLGLAIASLVLGIISIPLSFIVIGGLCGAIGLILSIIYLQRKYLLRTIAWWGLSLSIISLLISSVFAGLIYFEVQDFHQTMNLLGSQDYEEWIGKQTPNITLKDLDDNSFTLSSLQGKCLILDFWETWCPPCKMEIPHFVKLRNQYDANDLVIIGISSEDEETLRSFKKKHRINYLISTSSDLPSPYADITSIPTTFFIDREGIIKHVASGYHDFKELNLFVKSLDKEKDPNE